MNDDAPPRSRPADPLTSIVRDEAARLLAESRILPDPTRLAAGWERRFVVESRRVAEYLALYEGLGFEAAADPVRREQVEGDCDDCRIALLLEFQTIYTRRRGE